MRLAEARVLRKATHFANDGITCCTRENPGGVVGPTSTELQLLDVLARRSIVEKSSCSPETVGVLLT